MINKFNIPIHCQNLFKLVFLTLITSFCKRFSTGFRFSLFLWWSSSKNCSSSLENSSSVSAPRWWRRWWWCGCCCCCCCCGRKCHPPTCPPPPPSSFKSSTVRLVAVHSDEWRLTGDEGGGGGVGVVVVLVCDVSVVDVVGLDVFLYSAQPSTILSPVKSDGLHSIT